jgi:hypothetical protein
MMPNTVLSITHPSRNHVNHPIECGGSSLRPRSMWGELAPPAAKLYL